MGHDQEARTSNCPTFRQHFTAWSRSLGGSRRSESLARARRARPRRSRQSRATTRTPTRVAHRIARHRSGASADGFASQRMGVPRERALHRHNIAAPSLQLCVGGTWHRAVGAAEDAGAPGALPEPMGDELQHAGGVRARLAGTALRYECLRALPIVVSSVVSALMWFWQCAL